MKKFNLDKFSKDIYELRKKNFISKSPSITINERVYLGSWRADYVFESLCSSLIKKPEACYIEPTFNKKVKGVTLGSFLSIILVILLTNVFHRFLNSFVLDFGNFLLKKTFYSSQCPKIWNL